MKISDESFDFEERDLQEVFALFSSTSQDELGQIDDPGSDHYFDKVDLFAETISLPKIWAAVS